MVSENGNIQYYITMFLHESKAFLKIYWGVT